MQRLRPAGEAGQDLGAADRAWIANRTRRDGQPDERRVVALGPPRHDAPATTNEADDAATQRWRTCAAVASVSAGRSEPFISGQSGKTSAARRRHVRPEQQQREGGRGANAASSVNRWLAPRPPSRAG